MSMFTDGQIFAEAWNDSYAVQSDGIDHQSVFLYGVKISKSKEDGSIMIENIGSNKSNYIGLNDYQRSVFDSKGWRKGVYSVSMFNLEKLVEKYTRLISKEKDESKIKKYSQSRDLYESKLNKIKEKNEKSI